MSKFNSPKPLPNIARLREMFKLNLDTGELKWRPKPPDAHRAKWWNSVVAGKKAGSPDPGGRLRVGLDGEHFMAHRIVWKMVHDSEPHYIDHINGDGSDNRPENLRTVDFGENLKNKPLYKHNPHGFPGVGFHKRDKVWTAKIGVDGVQVQLGSFNTKEEAVAAMSAGYVLLRYHTNHGRKTDI